MESPDVEPPKTEALVAQGGEGTGEAEVEETVEGGSVQTAMEMGE